MSTSPFCVQAPSKRFSSFYSISFGACVLTACSAAPTGLEEDGEESAATRGSPGAQGNATPSPGFNGADSGAALPNGNPGGPSGPEGTCAATTVTATKPPVDIIFAVDQSTSMDNEITKVKQNINAFAQAIGTSGLDYQVIMLAAKSGSRSICVAEPLAGPGCSDNGSKFHAVDRYVGSHSAMGVIVDSYDKSWKQWARPAALKAFVVITDDESDMTTEAFDAALLAMPGGTFGTQGARNYVYNSVCGWKEGTAVPGGTKCPGTADAGRRHQGASLLSGGIVESVCKADYGAVLTSIAKKVTERLACEFAVPVASGSQAPDPTKVAVKLSAATAAPKLLTPVTDVSKCAQVPDAWFYDDNTKPTRIVLCKSTCDAAAALGNAKVDAQLGCVVPAPR